MASLLVKIVIAGFVIAGRWRLEALVPRGHVPFAVHRNGRTRDRRNARS